MQVNIILTRQGDSICEISSSESSESNCYIELTEGSTTLTALVSLEELKIALRKLTTK